MLVVIMFLRTKWHLIQKQKEHGVGQKKYCWLKSTNLDMIVEVVLVEAEGQEEDVVDGDDGGQRLGVVGTVGQQVRLHRS